MRFDEEGTIASCSICNLRGGFLGPSDIVESRRLRERGDDAAALRDSNKSDDSEYSAVFDNDPDWCREDPDDPDYDPNEEQSDEQEYPLDTDDEKEEKDQTNRQAEDLNAVLAEEIDVKRQIKVMGINLEDSHLRYNLQLDPQKVYADEAPKKEKSP